MIIPVQQSINDTLKKILEIARFTLQEQKAHLPTAILHTLEGIFPIVLPFKNDEQKRALMEYVKKQAIESHAFAVTTVTSARVVNSRTGAEQECLILATVVQRGKPYIVLQYFSRDEERGAIEFGAVVEGEDAIIPGQMIIFPEWDDEVAH
jgi:hypothetical protein